MARPFLPTRCRTLPRYPPCMYFLLQSPQRSTASLYFAFDSSSLRCLSVRIIFSLFMLVLVLSFRADPDDVLPADHGPEATQHLKAFIGDHYAYSDENVFAALWNSYNKCQFVEDDGKYFLQWLYPLRIRALILFINFR